MNHRFLLFLLGFLLLSQPSRSQFVRCEGKSLVTPDGNELLLRGLNLGGWLVPEGYILKIPGFGSPGDIRAKIVSLIGESAAESFYTAYEKNYITERDIAQIAHCGFDHVRLPFNYRMLSPQDQPGVFLEKGFARIDSLLAWCERNRLYVILDMHCAPGGQNAGNISDSDGTARLWTEPGNQDRTVEIWAKIAERYKEKTWILGYDILNEPVLPSGHTNIELRNLYLRICQAIRAVDGNHIIFLEGNNWATDFKDLTPPIFFGKNIAYSFHKYWNEITAGSIEYITSIRKLYNVPIWLGEFGENSNPWFYDTIRLMEDNKIGWSFWTYKKLDTITGPLSAPISPAYQLVLDYWNGKTTRPSAEVAAAALMDMATSLKLENCTFRPDVLGTMLQQDSAINPKPYQSHVLPGSLLATGYDMGKNNIAYYDKGHVMRDNYNQSSSWNSGWQFRNDAVDIGKTNAGAFYIGWIESDEWLRYTVQVDSGGIYDLIAVVASPSNQGSFKIFLNGMEWSPVFKVPNTGGWENWREVTVQNVSLPFGTHVLTIKTISGGYNLQRVDFLLKSPSKVMGSKQQDYLLGQNYPNPFNSETTIEFRLPDVENVTLQILNARGQVVKTLIQGQQAAGVYRVKWSGDNQDNITMTSGIYLYQLLTENQIVRRKMLFLR